MIVLSNLFVYFDLINLALLLTILPIIWIFGMAFFYNKSSQNILKLQGPKTFVTEFQILQKIVKISFPLLIVFLIITYFLLTIPGGATQYGEINVLFVIIAIELFFISYGGILTYFDFTRKAKFRFYHAKAYCQLIKSEKQEFVKIKSLIIIFDSYNQFLKKHFKLIMPDHTSTINNIVTNLANQEKTINEIVESFEKGELSPLRYFIDHFATKKDEFLPTTSLIDNLKSLLPLLGIIPPFILVVITLLTSGVLESINSFFSG